MGAMVVNCADLAKSENQTTQATDDYKASQAKLSDPIAAADLAKFIALALPSISGFRKGTTLENISAQIAKNSKIPSEDRSSDVRDTINALDFVQKNFEAIANQSNDQTGSETIITPQDFKTFAQKTLDSASGKTLSSDDQRLVTAAAKTAKESEIAGQYDHSDMAKGQDWFDKDFDRSREKAKLDEARYNKLSEILAARKTEAKE